MAANKGNGTCVSTFSILTMAEEPIDIVLVPPPPPGEPKPFVNTAELADAVQVATNVCINKLPVVMKKSTIPTSHGAPANAIKGFGSQKPPNGECTFLGSSATVFANGSPMIRHRDLTAQNHKNAVGGVKLKYAFSLAGSGIELDPNMSPTAKEAFVEDLEKLYERPRSREMLDTIRSEYADRVANGLRPNTITLSDRLEGALIAAEDAQANSVIDAALGHVAADEFKAGVGLPTIVSAVPGASVEQIGYGVIQSDVLLGHELLHALHGARGTTALGATLSSGATRATRNWELQVMGIGDQSNARLAEARFLEERGLPVRTSHGEGEHPFNPDPKSVAPRDAATGPNGERFVYVNK